MFGTTIIIIILTPLTKINGMINLLLMTRKEPRATVTTEHNKTHSQHQTTNANMSLRLTPLQLTITAN